MKIGLIVEGPTDYDFLSALLTGLLPRAVNFVAVYPKSLGEETAKQGETRGWTGVQKWLSQKGRSLERLINLQGLTFVVLQVDREVAGARPCEPSPQHQWNEISEQLLEWAGLDEWPDRVVLAITLQKLEAWVCAALEGCKLKNPQLEREPQPELYLPAQARKMVEKKKQRKNDEVGQAYKDFGAKAAKSWKTVLQCCPVGAGRFDQKLQLLATELTYKREK